MKNTQIRLFARRNVREQLDHANYLEWITDGSVENCSKLSVGIKSLEDLVALAIDLHSRVIHDARLGKYFVLTENMTYIHDPRVRDTQLDKPQLGKLLMERGFLQPQELETGLYYQKRIGCKLGESLIALGFIDESILYSTLAAQQHLSYYELQSDRKMIDRSWMTLMSINKARALQALPLGYRTDGKLVVACGDPGSSGTILALKEALGLNIEVVAARPSRIYELLQRLEKEEKEQGAYALLPDDYKTGTWERLTEDEYAQFISEYREGRINTMLFLKASGFVNELYLVKAPKEEVLIGWLTGKGLISGQIVNLIITLEKLVGKQSRSDRQQRVIPELLKLLEEAYYITPEDAQWIAVEHADTKVPVRHLLESNFLAATDTIANAEQILETVRSLVDRETN